MRNNAIKKKKYLWFNSFSLKFEFKYLRGFLSRSQSDGSTSTLLRDTRPHGKSTDEGKKVRNLGLLQEYSRVTIRHTRAHTQIRAIRSDWDSQVEKNVKLTVQSSSPASSLNAKKSVGYVECNTLPLRVAYNAPGVQRIHMMWHTSLLCGS